MRFTDFVLIAVVFVGTITVGRLLSLAVLAIYPDIDPIELHGRVGIVLTLGALLLCFYWFLHR